MSTMVIFGKLVSGEAANAWHAVTYKRCYDFISTRFCVTNMYMLEMLVSADCPGTTLATTTRTTQS